MIDIGDVIDIWDVNDILRLAIHCDLLLVHLDNSMIARARPPRPKEELVAGANIRES